MNRTEARNRRQRRSELEARRKARRAVAGPASPKPRAMPGRATGPASSKPRAMPANGRRRRGPAPNRPLRLALWTTAVLTVGTIFGSATFHVHLAQSQFELDRISKAATEEQERYESLRLEVARLAAPERVVATAKESLGMVVPSEVAYVTAPSGEAQPPGAAGTLAAGWSDVKRHLESSR